MKRTDMIELIIKAVFAASQDGMTLSAHEATDLLARIEAAGMKPPRLASAKRRALRLVYIEPDFNIWDEDFEKDKKALEMLNDATATRT